MTKPPGLFRSLSSREYGDVGGPPSPKSPVFGHHDLVGWESTRSTLRSFVRDLSVAPDDAQSQDLDTARFCAMLAERMDCLGLTLVGNDDFAIEQRRILTFMAANARTTTMRTTLALAIAYELCPTMVQAGTFSSLLSELVISSSATQLHVAQYLTRAYEAAAGAHAPAALDVGALHDTLVARRSQEAAPFTTSPKS